MASISFNPNTLRIRYKLGEPETCTFVYKDRDAQGTYQKGQNLVTAINGTNYFGGNIYRIGRHLFPGTYHAVTGGGNAWAWDWTLMAKGYTWLAQRMVQLGQDVHINSRTVPTISVQAIVAAIAGALGVSSNILGQPVFPRKIQIDQQSYASLLDRLAEMATQLSGVQYVWFIDANQVLQFYPLTLAPVGKMLGPDVPGGIPLLTEYPIDLEESLEQFADTVFLKLDKGLNDTSAPSPVPLVTDGNTTAWVLPNAAAGRPQVTVNGAQKTVGVDGVDSGFDFYFNTGSFVLRQDDNGAVLGSGDSLSATFIGHDLHVIKKPGNSIRGLGPCQVVLSAGDSENSGDYDTTASMELLRRNNSTFTLTGTVQGVPYSLGQQIPVQVPGLVTGYFILRGLEIFDVDALYLRSNLELVSGPLLFSGPQFMSRLVS